MKWPVVEVESIKASERNALVGGPFGSDLTSKSYVEDGVPVIRGNNLPDHTAFHDGDFVFVSDEKALSLSANTAGPRDLVFTQRGTLGQVGLIPDLPNYPRYVISQSQMKLTVNASKAEPRFVYYYFRLPTTVETIKSHVSSSGVPHINLGVLRRFKIPLPPLKDQRRIVEVAAAYDDLMENNRRRMALLEESARLLYREWFVHLRFPGHEPTRHINGVPQGWALKPLEEVAEFRLGKMLDEKKNRGEPLPYLANVNVRWGEFDLTNLREMRFEEHELETFGLKFGDIVMCEGGEPGRCAIWKEQMPGMMFQKAIHRIRCREDMEPEYLYQSLRHQAETGHFATLFTGATIKHFPREKLAKVTVVVPPKRLLDLFTSFARPIETQLAHLEAANKRARDARDLLLPRLMSGEIEV
ncbi:MAG: restriction endonuclease subunit S [Prosthecobacter sp.]|jgi:type I restriction enzyme S subunit|uniref:restriction endonuclease subunit S n=1 Tax=Prosthecobacter sp. TaxID=1965333 RepID=UPI001A02A932|nr:restriction endonuclease subunit S [Prosthecobacter sp.]MBE2285899.1 restriction endonuclease subunit S [Prosthecobacter sp.]